MAPTDDAIRQIEAFLRALLDKPAGTAGFLIRGVVKGGKLTVTKASVKQFEERRQ